MAAFPELREALTDGHLRLRLGAERDIPEILIAHQDDPMLFDRLGQPRAPSGAELGRASEAADALRQAGTHVELTLLQPGSDDCRGRIVVHDVDWEARRAELDVWVVPQLRGRGFARRALRLAASWLLEECGLAELKLLTESSNEPMMRAAQAAGFVNSGLERTYIGDRGERVEEVRWLLQRDGERR